MMIHLHLYPRSSPGLLRRPGGIPPGPLWAATVWSCGVFWEALGLWGPMRIEKNAADEKRALLYHGASDSRSCIELRSQVFSPEVNYLRCDN